MCPYDNLSAMLANHRLSIHVIADSSGETAARLARAAQAQFPQTQFSIVRHPRVKDADALLGVFDRITAARAAEPDYRVVILFTLVKREMAEMVRRYCDDKQIECADLHLEATPCGRSVRPPGRRPTRS